ncbi:hypothetical protein JOD82_002144 [Paenibacillus sp. 1182]|uniref:hypothetical protein n=1 Tax=Paenibacillus sp. 1182 TaxID=2806565 RepID=UPI001AE90ABE|nr:hypothetical protein [Paenibacillus sp. 1182]MBP1309124.1 hypothetical protein [Paenibacillus sp. 1182]
MPMATKHNETRLWDVSDDGLQTYLQLEYKPLPYPTEPELFHKESQTDTSFNTWLRYWV